jgi:TetR/AcrR family fatty acid metabolism transcriptional regulator
MKDAYQTRSTRDAILDATDRLLAIHGYKKMTIDDLAAEVGIGKGSVYLHFTSKEEIALSHIDRIIERLIKKLDVISRSGKSCEKRLTEMLAERILYRFDSVQHYRQSIDELLGVVRSKLLERRKLYFGQEAKIFGRLVEEGQSSGVFVKRNAMETANDLLIATNSLLPYSLSAIELGDRKELEKKVSSLANLLLSGLKRRDE